MFMESVSKQNLYNQCLDVIEKKISSLKESLDLVTEGIKNESKSTAGDKYEIERAMLHLEQEKLSCQLRELLDQQQELKKIDLTIDSKVAVKGSLVLTDKGYLFLSSAVGKIKTGESFIYAISMQSPLGKKLFGASKNDKIEMNGVIYTVKEIS